MLQELVKEYLSNPDFFFLDKTASEKLQLAQEYNREQKPSLATSCVVARMDIGIALDRVYNEEEAKEIMTAYKNCAKNLSEAKKTETDENKLDEINDTVNELSDTIRNFAGAHKEVAEQVLDIIDEYIGSERDFWTIEICLRHNHDIWERGFSIAHKIVDSEKRKAESRHKEHPELACSATVFALFNVLFDVASEPKNIEKIAKEYAAFDNNMNEGWLTDVSLHEVKGARGYLTEMGRREEFDNYPALMKYILRLSMMKKAANVKAKTRGMDDSDVKNYTFIYGPLSKDLDTPFAVIYKEFKEKYKDKLEALQVEDRMKKAKAMLPEAAEQKNIPVVNFNVDLVYAGKERPTLVTFEKIVPLTHDNYNPRLGNNKSKPKSVGLWTSPMEENGK